MAKVSPIAWGGTYRICEMDGVRNCTLAVCVAVHLDACDDAVELAVDLFDVRAHAIHAPHQSVDDVLKVEAGHEVVTDPKSQATDLSGERCLDLINLGAQGGNGVAIDAALLLNLSGPLNSGGLETALRVGSKFGRELKRLLFVRGRIVRYLFVERCLYPLRPPPSSHERTSDGEDERGNSNPNGHRPIRSNSHLAHRTNSHYSLV